VIDVEFMLGLGEEHFADVVVGQQFSSNETLTAVAFAQQQASLVFAMPAEKYGASTVLEQQQRGHCDLWYLLQLAHQHSPLQASTGRSARQQLNTQPLLGQWQASGQHRGAGGFLMQRAKS